MNYLHAFSPIISFVINAISQVTIFRYIKGFGLLRSIYIGFLLGICNLFFIEWYFLIRTSLSLSQNIASVLVNLITYSALAYCYFHFINLGETARRIRILRELYDSKEGLSLSQILQCYNGEIIIENRIKRLVNNRQIIYKDEKYYKGSHTMWLVAKAIEIMKLIVFGKKSKFD